MALGLALAWLVYAPGLTGGFIFDDFPNVVDNAGVHPSQASVGSLVRAALSSPASDFKRPLASLSFAANYLVTGLDPMPMKATNLVIHLLNGWLLYFVVARLLMFDANDVAGRRCCQNSTSCCIGSNSVAASAHKPHRRSLRGAAHGIIGKSMRPAWLVRLHKGP